jgi:hypothetical protein
MSVVCRRLLVAAWARWDYVGAAMIGTGMLAPSRNRRRACPVHADHIPIAGRSNMAPVTSLETASAIKPPPSLVPDAAVTTGHTIQDDMRHSPTLSTVASQCAARRGTRPSTPCTQPSLTSSYHAVASWATRAT